MDMREKSIPRLKLNMNPNLAFAIALNEFPR
jgi:hypothetical protein